jgi:Flp pilus assembly protein TadD
MVLALVAGCATGPAAPPPAPHALLRDDRFGAPSVPINPDEIFAVNDAMRRYLRSEVTSRWKSTNSQDGLVQALYNRGQLKLDYDTASTRTAAEAFEARTGNCLSLVVMTAAFTKELRLRVRYQSAYLEEAWSRSGDLLVRAGHVNITLGPKLADRAATTSRDLTIDFLPPDQARRIRTHDVTEQTIVVMFMNNRAVEALMRGRLDDAYGWARAAVLHGPDFLSAYNTLGIIYTRHGDDDAAEVAFKAVIERDPSHTRALSNLAELYSRQGRIAKAAELQRTLARLEPEPPFYFFDRGMTAMQRGDFAAARDLFVREGERSGYSTEVAYWIGVAYYRLGRNDLANRYLKQAVQNSVSPGELDLYTAKLAKLRSLTE